MATKRTSSKTSKTTTTKTASTSKARASAKTRTPKVTAKKTARVEAPKLVVRPAAVSAEARHAMIAEAAYLLAESRGFAPGGELADWIAAEREVSARLGR